MNDTKDIWENCLREVEVSVSKANFSTWFKNTHIIREESGIIHIGVPNEFVKEWLLSKFNKLILKTLTGISGGVRGVNYVVSKYPPRGKEVSAPTPQERVFLGKELPLEDLYIDKENNLNPRYLFDSFIVGGFNQVAYAAAQGVISKPGKVHNPFFVYGDTGLGKTHLIQAVGNSIKNTFPDKKIYYMTLEGFATDFVNSLKSKTTNLFKEKYRKYDVLIIDDIQFLGRMDKIQEEIFHTFNSFYENNKQIVFSSDKHPNFIPGLEERIRSRFSAGMTVDIKEPEYESRVAILKEKIKTRGVFLSDEIIEYVASSIQENVRELEGSLNSIVFQSQVKNKMLSLNEVKSLIKNSIKPKKNVSIKDVAKSVTDFYNLDEASIYEKTRRKEIVKARQIIMYILREDFNVSYPLIGQKLGGKDHTTVIHSFLKIKNDLKTDQNLNSELDQLRIMFK